MSTQISTTHTQAPMALVLWCVAGSTGMEQGIRGYSRLAPSTKASSLRQPKFVANTEDT